MNDFFECIIGGAIIFLSLYAISYLCNIGKIEAAAQAKLEKQRREAIRRAEEREKERQIQEAKRQNPWYPWQYLGHVYYNDSKRMQDILEELEAKGEWPNNPKK